jgi:hypothetical protein
MAANTSLTLNEICADTGFTITLSDSVDVRTDGEAVPVLVCGVASSDAAVDVSILTRDGDQIDFKNVAVNTVLRVRAKRVRATGTTASCVCVALSSRA